MPLGFAIVCAVAMLSGFAFAALYSGRLGWVPGHRNEYDAPPPADQPPPSTPPTGPAAPPLVGDAALPPVGKSARRPPRNQ
ncbi:MAG TPA: hypothetical protein VFI30_05685 [Nocardioidaceae bacterium]|nr:hypothetical protein [Nocardioidaceae bacterium]